MKQNINIEAEKNELILRNKVGDYTIIPAKHRAKVQKMLDDGCHSCIDELVDTLPVMADYANDGAVFPDDKEVEVYTGDQKYDIKTVAKRTGATQLPYEKEPSTHRMAYAEVNGEYVAYPTLFQDKNNKWVDLDVAHNNVDKWAALREARKRGETFSFKDEKSAAEFAKGSWKNNYKKMNTSSEEYRTLYNEGKIAAYDKETDAYIATPLKEVTITGGAPQWSKYKREYEKTNPKSDYINRYLTSFAKAIGNTKTNYPKRLDDEYEQNSLDYVSEQLVKNKPQGKLSRAEWLNQMSDKEEELIKRNPKYQSSLWADTKRGLTSLVEQNPLQTFQNILTSSDYSNREKREMLKDYADHPIMSKLGDAAKILNPLTVPSKMVQSAYKDDYSFTDALKGKKNNAGIVEDIVTDPLNLVGAGLVGKLSKADKVIDATKILNKIDNNSFYRQIGKEGYEDAIKTGVIRSKPIGEYAGKAPYFVEGKDFDNLYSTGAGAGGKKPEYIFEMPQLKNPEEMSAFRVNQQEGYAPYVAGSKEIPISQGKIYRLNNKNEYELVDATKAGSKVLNKTDDVVKQATSSVDDVNKSVKPAWQMQELPGLHLKSTMEGEAISKLVEPKTGLVNVEQALGIIGKESGGADKVALIKQGLGDNIPKKMGYNDFRKIVQDQLIPLEKQFSSAKSNYGIDRLGYNTPTRGGFNNRYVIKEAEAPLENQTLILGNKNKFGAGSSAHNNPDETLGHIHFLRDAETPDVLTVTQIQSDAFQGTHKIMPKNAPDAVALERQQKSLQRMEEIQERNKSVLNKMKTEGVDEAGLPVQDYQIKQFEDIVKAQEQTNLFKKAHIENFTQKQLLDKNHQERYLQELVDYAGKRGDVNKVRVPTSETAAKVQGYKPVTTAEEIIEKHNKLKGTTEWDEIMSDTPNADKVRFEKILKGEIKGDIYSTEHQTILKKYAEQPKTIKKLFGEEPKIVTDSKGNTWYEFDIPKKFKEGKGEIKAFGLIPPAIGIGTAIQSQQNKTK